MTKRLVLLLLVLLTLGCVEEEPDYCARPGDIPDDVIWQAFDCDEAPLVQP